MTKEQQIIERLASKELSFGCLLKGRDTGNIGVFLRHEGDYDVMFPLEKGGILNYVDIEINFEILGHPVYIGDVLKLIDKKYSDDINDDSKPEAIMDLIHYWSQCCLSKSLQQIVEESGYECNGCNSNWNGKRICCPEHPNLHPETRVRLKSPQARSLFEFLDPITQTI